MTIALNAQAASKSSSGNSCDVKFTRMLTVGTARNECPRI